VLLRQGRPSLLRPEPAAAAGELCTLGFAAPATGRLALQQLSIYAGSIQAEDLRVLELDASGMRELTRYAPIRVALTGIWRVIFGTLLGVPAGLLIWIGPAGEPGAPRAPGDMPPWWMFFVGLVLAFVAFAFVSGGVGRMVSAFARRCYFRAGPQGVAIRLPKQGWFGRFRLTEYNIRWNEIQQLVHFTHRHNGIPVARELRIQLSGGKTVIIERFYFSASVMSLQEQLLTIGASVGK